MSVVSTTTSPQAASPEALQLEKAATPQPGMANFSWRIPAIDGVRALAILMVYCYHSWNFADDPVKMVNIFGWQVDLLGAFHTFPAGVDLFIVLSGFCLFLPLCKSPDAISKWDVKRYFQRRCRRIVPPYYAAILFVILLPQIPVFAARLMGNDTPWKPWPSAEQIITHLLFIHTLFIETWEGLNGSFWSLGLEAQLYLTFPLVVWGFLKYKTRVLWFMIGVSILYRIIAGFFTLHADQTTQFVAAIFFLGRWMQFAIGMAAAWIVAQHWHAGHRYSARLGTLAIGFAVALYIIAVGQFATQLVIFPLRHLLLGLATGSLLLALCITHTPLRALFENKVMAGLGFISYSVFLIHGPTGWYIAELLKRKFGYSGAPLLVLLCTVVLLIVILASYIFFLIFERPFIGTAKPVTKDDKVKVTHSEGVMKSDTNLTVATVQDQALP